MLVGVRTSQARAALASSAAARRARGMDPATEAGFTTLLRRATGVYPCSEQIGI